MPEQQAFLDALREQPADDTTRLVYADWLDEHDDAARATYLRDVAALAGQTDLAEDDPAVARCCSSAEHLDPTWRQTVGARFELVLSAIGSRSMIWAIKRIREQFGCGLAVAKGIAESAPTPLECWVTVESAVARKRKLSHRPVPGEAGTTYKIRPSTLPAGSQPGVTFDIVLNCQSSVVLAERVPAELRNEPFMPEVRYHPAVDIAVGVLVCSYEEAVARLQSGSLTVARGLRPHEVAPELIRLRGQLNATGPVAPGVMQVLSHPSE